MSEVLLNLGEIVFFHNNEDLVDVVSLQVIKLVTQEWFISNGKQSQWVAVSCWIQTK